MASSSPSSSHIFIYIHDNVCMCAVRFVCAYENRRETFFHINPPITSNIIILSLLLCIEILRCFFFYSFVVISFCLSDGVLFNHSLIPWITQSCDFCLYVFKVFPRACAPSFSLITIAMEFLVVATCALLLSQWKN